MYMPLYYGRAFRGVPCACLYSTIEGVLCTCLYSAVGVCALPCLYSAVGGVYYVRASTMRSGGTAIIVMHASPMGIFVG